MPRYVALLRGVSPLNCKMPALARCFGALGFTDVKTHFSSGNVVFSSTKCSLRGLETTIEAGTAEHLGRTFGTFVRTNAELRELLASDPFAGISLPAASKRVVTFLRAAPAQVSLPVGLGGAQIVRLRGREALSFYVPSPNDPAFMRLIEKTFGSDVTTRTWDTVMRLAR